MVREVRDLARAAVIAERLAVERVIEEMSRERCRLDPSTTALNMSKVKVSNIDKMLALTGRPPGDHGARYERWRPRAC